MKKEFDIYDSSKYIQVKKSKIIAKGGDGTLLKAISKYNHLNLPFYGIAAGTVNFLMNSSKDTTDQRKLKFTRLKVEITYKDYINVDDLAKPLDRYNLKTSTCYAFNDIVIGNFNAWINFDCKHDTDILGKFSGSGLIISTAQGSTGINRNNSGVILPLSSKDLSITGMQCNRSINYVLEPEDINIYCNSRDSVKVAIDGNSNIIENVSSIKISKGDTTTLIFNNYSEFKRKRRL